MPRLDPRFNAFDVIRIVEQNLDVANKRLVFAWFFSTIPIKEPQVDVVQLLLTLLSAIPFAGSFAALFQISIATAQVAKDIADLFQFELEEEEVELAKLTLELQLLREEFNEQRNLLLRCQIDLDNEKERVQAFIATVSLLNEEIHRLEVTISNLVREQEDREELDLTELVRLWRVVERDLNRNTQRIGNILFVSFQTIPRINREIRRLQGAT